jgi:hypothetical protein
MGTITTTGCITLFRDDGGNGQEAEIHLPMAQSFAAVQTFAKFLADFTTASIIEASWTQTIDFEDLPGSDGETQSMEDSAMLLLRGASQTKRFKIPAPREDLFTVDPNGKTIVSLTKGAAFAAAYAALTGETCNFVRGRFE